MNGIGHCSCCFNKIVGLVQFLLKLLQLTCSKDIVFEVDNIDDFPLLSHEDQCRSTCRAKDQPLPSNVVTADQLSHLNSTQRQELCGLLDSCSECFSDKPGFCSYIEHHIDISKEFQPKQLREYRIPELMKAEVQRQIDELAYDGFIVPSTGPMASPLVCVLKGKDGKGGVRLAVDYKYVNSYTQNDAYVMPNLSDLMHKVCYRQTSLRQQTVVADIGS